MDTIKEKINKSKNFHVVISGYSIKFRSKSISKIKKMSANVTNRFFFFVDTFEDDLSFFSSSVPLE